MSYPYYYSTNLADLEDELCAAFGSEWTNLDRAAQADILEDFLDTADDATEYRRNIGEGNLASYARTLRKEPHKASDLLFSPGDE